MRSPKNLIAGEPSERRNEAVKDFFLRAYEKKQTPLKDQPKREESEILNVDETNSYPSILP